jgi:hypothetical protein
MQGCEFLDVKKFPYLKLGPFGNPIFSPIYTKISTWSGKAPKHPYIIYKLSLTRTDHFML